MPKLIGRMQAEAEKTPFSMAAAMLLIALACIAFPVKYFVQYTGELVALALVRTVFGAIGIVFMLMFGFTKYLGLGKSLKKNWDVAAVSLLVAVNNFPIVPLITGDFTLSASAGTMSAYLWFCLSVGLFEEIFFRGLILLLTVRFFRKKRLGKLWAVLTACALFGLVHLFNLMMGADIGAVLLQVGYSSLIGAMMSVVLLMTRSVIYPVLLHAVYDVGGLMSGYVGQGTLWTPATIALTAAVGVLCGAWITVRFVRAFCVGQAAEALFLQERAQDQAQEQAQADRLANDATDRAMSGEAADENEIAPDSACRDGCDAADGGADTAARSDDGSDDKN